jgi:hypothetical protein
METRFDSSEVRGVVDALNRASRVALPDVTRVVAVGARNIQQDWRRRWSGFRHAPALPAAITYDVFNSLRGPAADIGPDKNRRQGALGNLLEYGSIKNAPIPGGAPAAQAEEPRFAKALEDLMVKALGLD